MNVRIESAGFFRQLHDLGAGLQNNMSQAVRIATHATHADAKATTLFKDRTGDLRGSIGQSTDGLKGKVFRGRKAYFGFVANGTQPHVIIGRNAGMLRFQMNGRWVSARMVNHPGTAPRPFMQHAYDVGKRTLDAVGERFANAAIRRFNA